MHLRQGLDARGERVLGDGPWAVVRDRGAPDRHCESRYVTPFLKWSHVAATKCGLYDIAILFTQMAQIARIRPSHAARKCPYPFGLESLPESWQLSQVSYQSHVPNLSFSN